MNARLAMLACKGAHKGPWTRTQGSESGIRAHQVGEGGSVVVEYDLRGSSEHTRIVLDNGDHPFHHPDSKRFRFVKLIVDGLPTTVEVLFK